MSDLDKILCAFNRISDNEVEIICTNDPDLKWILRDEEFWRKRKGKRRTGEGFKTPRQIREEKPTREISGKPTREISGRLTGRRSTPQEPLPLPYSPRSREVSSPRGSLPLPRYVQEVSSPRGSFPLPRSREVSSPRGSLPLPRYVQEVSSPRRTRSLGEIPTRIRTVPREELRRSAFFEPERQVTPFRRALFRGGTLPETEDIMSSLRYAITLDNEEGIISLLERGLDEQELNSALRWAARQGRPRAIRLLLDYGATDLREAADIARESGFENIARMLE